MIRNAETKDINRILELLGTILEYHHNLRPDLFKSNSSKYSKKEIEELLSDSNTNVFVYTDGTDYVLGYVICLTKITSNNSVLMDHKTLYVDDLCVDESNRGKRIGTKLMEYVYDFAIKNQYDSVTLNVWDNNQNAKSFYEKLGYSNRRIIMEKNLK